MLSHHHPVQRAALAILLASAAHAAPLLSNGSANPSDPALATGALSANGVAAPANAQWSELAADASGANALAGVSAHTGSATGVYRLADDFTVSGFAYGWSVASISFFSTISDPAASFASLHARIWSGIPNAPGSAIVWDSTSAAATLTTAPLALYRIFNSTALPLTAPGSTRQVWQLDLTTPGLTLAPGTYWIDWQTTLSNTGASAFVPTVTLIGARGSINANAMQFKPIATVPVWTGITDPGKPAAAADVPQELPFLIEGASAAPPCPGDADNSGTVNFADITAVLTNWSGNYLPSTGPGDAEGNGLVNFADITSVLQGWGASCR